MLPREQRKAEYNKIHNLLQGCSADEIRDANRKLYRTDLFYLLVYGCGRKDMDRDWLFDRCVEIQNEPNGFIDLWARDHYKSTIITYGKTIQDILASHGDNPLPEWKGIELTACVLSHTNPIATAFLNQIKSELETNARLKFAFPDVLYENPKKEAPKWSLEKGIVVKRKSNPKEPTVFGSGLVDGMPTGSHFGLLIYDDIVVDKSVTTADQIKKTTAAWELSTNLGSQEGYKERYIGTRYHFNDTWKTIMDREAATPRIYPATKNGKRRGEPVLLSKEALEAKANKQGSYTFSCQMLQNPKDEDGMGFKEKWISYYTKVNHDHFNTYIFADPASSKKRKENDWSTFLVFGAAPDKNLYLIDAVRDKFTLNERTETLFKLQTLYSPIDVYYEEFGLQADIEHIEYVQEERNYRFKITPTGENIPKEIRIMRLQPYFENSKIYLPYSLPYRNYEGKMEDLIKYFINNEYLPFPVSKWDDFIDCMAQITDKDVNIVYPVVEIKKAEPTMAENDWNVIWGTGQDTSACTIDD